jgi:hypothetical protein
MSRRGKRKGVILLTMDGVRMSDMTDTWMMRCAERRQPVSVENEETWSYAGYHEILCGFNDTKIVDNSPIVNENATAFDDVLRSLLVCASWNVFKFIYGEKIYIPSLHEVHETSTIMGLPERASSKDSTDENAFAAFCNHWLSGGYEYGHLALGASDEHAHDGNFDMYKKSLLVYDVWAQKVWNELRPEYMIVTTDHGRGNNDFRNHGSEFPGSSLSFVLSFGFYCKDAFLLSDVYLIIRNAVMRWKVTRLLQSLLFYPAHPFIAKIE